MTTWRRTLSTVALLTLLMWGWTLVPIPVCASDGPELGGASVEILSRGAAIPLEVGGEPTRERPVLLTEWVQLAPEQQIEDLLEARDLEVDGGTYSLIYALNPRITDLSNLEPGSRLQLPSVHWASDEVPPERLRLIVDRPLKHELQEELEVIAVRSRELGGVPLSRFGTTETERSRILESLAAIEQDLRLIGTLAVHDLMVVDANFLNDVTGQADLVSEILHKLTEDHAPLSSLDATLLEDVRKDLAVRSAAVVETKGPGEPPMRFPAERVEVHTFLPGGQPVRDLRVYYVPPALCGRVPPEEFNGLSTPATATLDEATYIFWAGHSAETSLAVPHRGEVRRRFNGNPIRVDLLIEEPPEERGNDADHQDPCGRS